MSLFSLFLIGDVRLLCVYFYALRVILVLWILEVLFFFLKARRAILIMEHINGLEVIFLLDAGMPRSDRASVQFELIILTSL